MNTYSDDKNGLDFLGRVSHTHKIAYGQNYCCASRQMTTMVGMLLTVKYSLPIFKYLWIIRTYRLRVPVSPYLKRV